MMTTGNDTSTTDFSEHYIGNYRLLRLLGQGAFATVYLGEHRYLRRLAAIKVLRTVLNNRDKERFIEEARLLATLSHPNIVRVLEFAVTHRVNHARNKEFSEYIPYLIMDFAPGGSLRTLCSVGSCLSIDAATGYIKQIAAALQYAHNHGIIHRDVKPENCLLNEQQEVMLSDFGLALFAPTPDLLSTQQMEGTLPYTAPEQLRGKPDFASDQYSLAIIAYEWLCGHQPFKGEEVEIIMQHIASLPPGLRSQNPAISQAVEDVVLRGLEKDPQRRYPDVQAFAEALEQASWRSIFHISPHAHTAAGAFPPDARPASPYAEVGSGDLSETSPSCWEEEIQTPQLQQEQAPWFSRTRSRKHQSPISSSRRKKQSISFIIGILTFLLILGSSGNFYLNTLTTSPDLIIQPHPTLVATAPVTAFSSLPAMGDFTTKPPLIHDMKLISDETSFEGDHAALGAGQQVTVDFFLPGSPQPGKSKQASIFISALVARSGNNHGYAPMNLFCNGKTIVQDFTIPGEGFLPNETGFQIPPGNLVDGKNEIKLLIVSGALSEFWLYHIAIDTTLLSTTSVANFTVKPPRVQGMTLGQNDTIFGNDHSALLPGQQVIVDYSSHDTGTASKPVQMNILMTALVARTGNFASVVPLELSCNKKTIVQNFTMPGEGFQPETISFQIPPGYLAPGKNEITLLISPKAENAFWLYSLGIKPGAPY